jgi:hypothetical protein
MTRAVLLFAIVALLLTGCSDASAPGYDLRAERDKLANLGADLEKLNRDIDQQFQRTADWMTEQGQMNAIVAERLEIEKQGTQAALANFAEEVAIKGTAEAPIVAMNQMQATMQAEATAAVATATAYAPTLVANMVAIEKEKSNLDRTRVMNTIIPPAVVVALVIFAVAGFLFIMDLGEGVKKWIDWRIQKERILVSIRDGLYGTQTWDTNEQKWYIETNDKYKKIPVNHGDRPLLRDDGVKYAPPNHAKNTTALPLIQAVLEAAIRKEGPNGVRIPRYDKLDNVTRTDWQKAREELAAEGLVDIRDKEGTYITRGDLSTVLYQIDEKLLKLSPSPTRGYGND